MKLSIASQREARLRRTIDCRYRDDAFVFNNHEQLCLLGRRSFVMIQCFSAVLESWREMEAKDAENKNRSRS
jgi:hypothetical protein